MQHKRKLKFEKKICLELGAGCSGTPGMELQIKPRENRTLIETAIHSKGTVLSMLGASKVFLTDVECILPMLKRNLQMNSTPLAACDSSYIGFIPPAGEDEEDDDSIHKIMVWPLLNYKFCKT